jgi:D-alanyl-D-alanine carboxypeptidase (penicillin-binding protein 5/6)
MKVVKTLFLVFTFFFCISGTLLAKAKEEEEGKQQLSLYASSAVLMDADSGRVLYGKDETAVMANASTTKILTAILILENCSLDDEVEASDYAASMPKVHLGMQSGDRYLLKDLLYSLMLESHNDSAVALAEHMSGSVEAFAEEMNKKAEEIGCTDSFFLTPNGLDAQTTVDGEEKFHSTTALDLAKIMRYCVTQSEKKEDFLEITQTLSKTISCINRSYTVSLSNHNQLLTSMDGALSGKTGFTAKAGYCYVGAVEREERCYIVALLACGWPNNRSYKWADCQTLFDYGFEAYQYRDFKTSLWQTQVEVTDGVGENENPYESVSVSVAEQGETSFHLLAAENESIQRTVQCEKTVSAPVRSGDTAGSVIYTLLTADGMQIELAQHSLIYTQDIPKWDFYGYVKYIFRKGLFAIAFF